MRTRSVWSTAAGRAEGNPTYKTRLNHSTNSCSFILPHPPLISAKIHPTILSKWINRILKIICSNRRQFAGPTYWLIIALHVEFPNSHFSQIIRCRSRRTIIFIDNSTKGSCPVLQPGTSSYSLHCVGTNINWCLDDIIRWIDDDHCTLVKYHSLPLGILRNRG